MKVRKQIINDFLNYFGEIVAQNPMLKLNDDMVYGELVRLGVGASQRKYKINNLFEKWIFHFKNNRNCEVYVKESWKYFCQFKSRTIDVDKELDHLKVYIPLDKDHIERGAKEIFEFLSKENIPHHSKIGSNIRFDDVVVRLISPTDLKKLIAFLNKNKFIQEGLMPANPFAFSINGIALATDGRISFNSTIATLISLYIKDKKLAGALNKVNVDDFYNYIQNYYDKVFSSKEGLTKLSVDFSEYKSLSEKEILNYKNVINLILKCSKDNFTYDNYIEHFKECSNPVIQEKKLEEIRNIDLLSEKVVKSTNKLLLEVVNLMLEKYQKIETVILYMKEYLKTGDDTYLTRYKGLREKVVNSTLRSDLNKILAQKNCSFSDYVESLIAEPKLQKSNEKSQISISEKKTIMILNELLNTMVPIYGKKQTYANLKKYITDGDITYITRTNNLRMKIFNSTFLNDIRNYLSYRNIKLENLLDCFFENSLDNTRDAEVYLEQAIMETYSNYEKKYQMGLSRTSGEDFVISSIAILINEEHYDGFTNDNNARRNLEENVSIKEAIDCIKKELSLKEIDRNSLSKKDRYSIAQAYISKVLGNNQVKRR